MKPESEAGQAGGMAVVWPTPVEASRADLAAEPVGVVRRRTADRVFLGCLLATAAVALAWLFFLVTQRSGGVLFRNYNLTTETLQRIAGSFVVFWIGWGWLWYFIKKVLLRKMAGFSDAELQKVFASRMGTPFSLTELLSSHSERRIRIVDMITRRGRTVIPLLGGFIYFYFYVSRHPGPEALAMGIQDNFIEAVALSGAMLGSYYTSGFFGRAFYGAHSRVMDGTLGRANVLLIGTMWSLFKFVMVPLGLRLGAVFPPDTYAVLFVFIWVSYVASDTLSEVVGALWGKQKLRVWGLGEVNRKSVAGTWACFLGALVPCIAVVLVQHLPLAWLGLAVVIALANTATELFSPRGTDDFIMATTNALICWGFGAFVL